MGIVYQARDLALGRKVAIKTLPRVSPEFARRLRREARAVAAVSHPNLASIFGAETWRGTPLLIFEFLEGGTLASRLSKSRLDWGEVLDLGITLGEVLERLHSAGILHRDIKPTNIGYTRDGVPKLLDFGLAEIVPHSCGWTALSLTQLTNPSELPTEPSQSVRQEPGSLHAHIVGTLAYISPEAARGRRPDPMFDLWSLSVVLFEAKTSVNPFRGDTARDTHERILRAKMADLRQLLPECPEAAIRLFEDLLALDRGRRPATAKALCARLVAARDALAPPRARRIQAEATSG